MAITKTQTERFLRDTLLAAMLMGLVSFCGYHAVAHAHNHCKSATFNYEDYRFCMGI